LKGKQTSKQTCFFEVTYFWTDKNCQKSPTFRLLLSVLSAHVEGTGLVKGRVQPPVDKYKLFNAQVKFL